MATRSLRLKVKEIKAVHMGDIFPTTAHKNPLWVTAYDDYPMQSIREKGTHDTIFYPATILVLVLS
ncbi:metallo-beta-lactamase [Staphylococcus aureus]|uniref:Metallo-beta-lactamase n=1 Tax=Staphylococcus aureus TaxID=1280 RepID=A0A380E4A9_STAAU|nr:metallo-beta-lactamase [Staphylococcus aureus]